MRRKQGRRERNPFDSRDVNAIVWLFRSLRDEDIDGFKGIRTWQIRYVLGAPRPRVAGRPPLESEIAQFSRVSQDIQAYDVLESLSDVWGDQAEGRFADLTRLLSMWQSLPPNHREEQLLMSYLANGLSLQASKTVIHLFYRFMTVVSPGIRGGACRGRTMQDAYRELTMQELERAHDFLLLHGTIAHLERLQIWTKNDRRAFGTKHVAKSKGVRRARKGKRVFADYEAQAVRRHCVRLERLGFLEARRDRGRGHTVTYYRGPNMWTDPYRWLDTKRLLAKAHLDDTRTQAAVTLVGISLLPDMMQGTEMVATLNEFASELRSRELVKMLSAKLPTYETRGLPRWQVETLAREKFVKRLEAVDRETTAVIRDLHQSNVPALSPGERTARESKARERMTVIQEEFRSQVPQFPLVVIDLNSLAFEKL